jgi:hypothetical protein
MPARPSGKKTGHEDSTLSLTSALYGVGGELHAPAVLPPGKTPGIQRKGDRVGPRIGLDGRGKSCSHRDSIPRPCSPLRVATPTELYRITKDRQETR